MPPSRPPFLFLLIAPLLLVPVSAGAVDLPADFVAENAVPSATFVVPVGITFFPAADGRMLVIEKQGRVWVVKNGVKLPTPMWQSQNEVLDEQDRGLLDVAIDPNYTVNHYVYFLYTVDPDSNGVDDSSDGFGRLVRYRTSAADSNVVDPSTRTILFGTKWSDAPIIGSPSHTIGSLRWGADQSLLVSTGDGAQFNQMDAGGLDPQMFTSGRASPYENIGAFRSQYLGSLDGKILRINRFTGRGYPSNPFWNGDAGSVRSRVWAYGLRNPFRFTVRPGTGAADSSLGQPGTIYLGEVGWVTWEEMNVVKSAGTNFGWPCYEGIGPNTSYQQASPSHSGCDSIATNPWNPNPVTPPLATWNHDEDGLGVPPGFHGNASIGGVWSVGTGYPGFYRNRYFFGDYGQNWIKMLISGPNDSLISIQPFAENADGPVCFAVSPANGDLYYVSIVAGEVRRIRYTGQIGTNHSPTAIASGSPSEGLPPVDVSFSSAGSWDIDQDTLSYEWTFGDGSGSTAPNPSHAYSAPGLYQAILTVDDGHGAIGRDTVTINVFAEAPFPSTAVLDNFNRANGPIGGSWVDQTSGLFINNNAVIHTGGYASVIRDTAGAIFGSSQEAWFKLLAVTSTAPEHDVMLKIQGTSSWDSHIEVRYDATIHGVNVATYTPGPEWEHRGGPYPVTLQPGDVFGARALGDGKVEVFVNGVRIGLADCSGWIYATSGGRIGMAFADAVNSRIDDFGGGNVVFDTPPTAAALAPPDSSFYVAGDTLMFRGAASDAEQAPGTLSRHWSVHLIHNNHFHVEAEVDSDSAKVVALDHEDGTGVHLLARYIVTDSGGLSDTATVNLFPEVDLDPESLAVVPASPSAGAQTLYEMFIANHGRLQSRRFRWRLVANTTLVAEGDTAIAALDTIRITQVLPGLPAGSYTLRLVADTLAQVVETVETNNARVAPLIVTGPSTGVGSVPLRLALSGAIPNPTRGGTDFALELPWTRVVDFSILDIQGRVIWTREPLAMQPGRTTLHWSGTTAAGQRVHPGLYFARVRIAGEPPMMRRLVLID